MPSSQEKMVNQGTTESSKKIHLSQGENGLKTTSKRTKKTRAKKKKNQPTSIQSKATQVKTKALEARNT